MKGVRGVAGAALACAAACALAGGVAAVEPGSSLAAFTGFQEARPGGPPEGWAATSPRDEIAAKLAVEPGGGRSGGGALLISADRPEQQGAWRTEVPGVRPGLTYRFSAWYRATGVAHERRSVSAWIEWLDGNGRPLRAPDFALDAGRKGGWTEVEHVAEAPERAERARITLSLAWAPGGRVRWDDVRLVEERSRRRRVVRAVTVFHRPRGTKSAAESVERFCRLLEGQPRPQADLVCLPEGVTVIGTGKSYAEVAEPVPGPTTRRLGETARRLNAYVVAGLYERVGSVIYNTAVLIDRKGEVTGRYRKTHLPREEVEAGLTPGNEYPVFDTDFGRVGLLICWDVQFPEPARAMALQGAEILLLPIWGGSEVLARARAIENHVFLLSSSYDMKTFIVNPAGEVLAEASAERPLAAAELRLDNKIIQPWLGDMKPRTWKERRPDIPVERGAGGPPRPDSGPAGKAGKRAGAARR